MTGKLNDDQLEAVKRLINCAEVVRVRGNVALSWDDYRMMAGLMKRMSAVLESKTYQDESTLKKDLTILMQFTELARKHRLLNWEEGAAVAAAVTVFSKEPGAANKPGAAAKPGAPPKVPARSSKSFQKNATIEELPDEDREANLGGYEFELDEDEEQT